MKKKSFLILVSVFILTASFLLISCQTQKSGGTKSSDTTTVESSDTTTVKTIDSSDTTTAQE